MSLRILPVTAGKATSGDGFVLGHPGLVFKPVAITGTIQILFPQNRVPKLESLAVHFEGKVTFPAVPEQPSTEKAETKDKKKDDVNTDDYELVAMKRVLIELAVPVKLSDMSTDASVRPHTHHISHFKSTPSLSERPPLVLPPYASSSSVSLSSHASSSSPIHLGVPKGFGSVEVKFRFDMTAEEAADLPPAADMTPSSAEALSPKNNLVKLGVHYQLRAVARFAGTFENKEVVETVPIPWPKFHPDAVSRVIGTGERKVKRSGVSAKGFRWRWEILSGVGALGDMRPLALFLTFYRWMGN
ncbi:hypothetical protein BC829DRAFT_33617 [Chytridium lagenaria]|nr:hypothetical protein BC829DRAFT_33617 [Chytridium lagenaria]